MSLPTTLQRAWASPPYDPNQCGSNNLTPLVVSSPDRHPVPASAMRESTNATYTPPSLPEYLKNVCDLRPIVGIPKDDEVKGIHAVLRMAHSTTHIPGIFDPELSMNLAQHLFGVQLARHRERYPFGLFPQDVVYTPPTLPSHVAVDLKPVHGIPSDEELQDVHAAVHAYEHVSNVPSLFDPKVEMELSQHLFNIQLARYMSREPERDPEPKSKVRSKKKRAPKPSHTSTPDLASDPSDEEATQAPQCTGPGDSVEPQEPGVQTESIGGSTDGEITIEGPNRLLEELVETMKGIKQVLIGAHHSHARGSRRSRFLGTGPVVGGFELMNDKGELPAAKGLPTIGKKGYYFQYDSALTADQLARYLQFYNIGHDLVDTGDKPTIREGQRAKAEDVLSNYLN